MAVDMDLERQVMSRLESGSLRGNLPSLFYETLNWGADQGPKRIEVVNGQVVELQPIARLGGVPVFMTEMPEDATSPKLAFRRDLHKKLAETDREHLMVYTSADGCEAHFVAARRLGSGKTELRTLPFARGMGNRTTVERIIQLRFSDEELGLYGDPAITSVTEKIEIAFNVETVTRRFFQDYRSVFETVEGLIQGDVDDKRLFVQRFMNRLMFIQFLAKKGWLRFGEAEGSADYLHALWEGRDREANFYSAHLCPLFFVGLANPKDRNLNHDAVLQSRIGRVPYLNGGLFDRLPEDNQDVCIPDAACEAVLQLFDRYNFTITESTPLDIMVAIDPEMLGKVFEELVTGRHESGSYYTPRPIVSFMCRETLKGYLVQTGASSEEVAAFVDNGEPERLRNPEAILTALKTVTVCDPACGSGAYLLGMMQELLRLRARLFASKALDFEQVYRRKLEIIERNLYGVDKDPFAVNIAMLRLWLSLVVDDERNPLEVSETPIEVALPNLKFKIQIGDSLLAPAPALSTMGLQRHAYAQDAARLHQHHTEYFKPRKNKDAIEGQIAADELKIAKLFGTEALAGSVDWRVKFAEVFAPQESATTLGGGQWAFNEALPQQALTESDASNESGFHICLANPPYLRQEIIKDLKPALQKVYPDVYAGTADLYCYFYARALQLLRPGGMLAFISPNKWFRAGYGAKLRDHIARNCCIHSITDFGELPVFQSAATFPMIFVAEKDSPGGTTIFTQVKSLFPPYPDVKAIVDNIGQRLPSDAIRGTNWTLTSAASAGRVRQMECKGTSLNEYVSGQIFYGVKTGFNTAFVISAATRAGIIAEDPRSIEVIKPLSVGNDIRKWRVVSKNKWIIFTRRGIDIDAYPAVKRHLAQWRSNLEPKPRDWPLSEQWQGRKSGSYKWYEIQDDVAYFERFSQPKIIFPDIGKEPRFAFDTSGTYTNDTTFIISVSDFYLLGVLNSSPVWNYLSSKAAVLGDSENGGRMRLKRQYVQNIPVPMASETDRAAISALVQKCLDAQGVLTQDWESEIDERVAALYGL